jgi:hypothetical protein
MRRMLATLSLILVVGLLVAVATRGGGQSTGTAVAPSAAAPRAAASGYPAPGSPAPPPTQPAYPGPHPTPYPTIVAHPMPTPVLVTQPYPPPGVTAPPTPTPYRLAPTPTWGPLPTVLPTVIPANLPSPTGYPSIVPRRGLFVASESDSWSISKLVDSSTYVIRARVARIDPPFWQTADGREPVVIDYQNVATPALLTVEKVYKGPPMTTIEVGVAGACFAPARCTSFLFGYTWQDVIGYDLILFIVDGFQAPGRPAKPTTAVPIDTFIVNPDSGKDEALWVRASESRASSLSDLLAQIRSAPSANP